MTSAEAAKVVRMCAAAVRRCARVIEDTQSPKTALYALAECLEEIAEEVEQAQ